MGDLFLKMLKESLPHCRVGNWVELPYVSKSYSEQIPSFNEVEVIARETLSGLEYRLSIREGNGEMSKKGDFFLEFPIPSHFMILSRAELLYAAVINIGWRGRPIMVSRERDKYLAFLQKYFREPIA